MNKLTLMALAATFSVANAAAFAEGFEGKGPGGPGHHGPPKFEAVDTNKDGYLTRDEMEAHHKQKLNKMFEKTDTDKDSKLSKEELKKGREEMREKMRKHFKEKREAKEAASPAGETE